MVLIAARLIDVAIFGSLGILWIGGALFIVVLYRWILRFEREEHQGASFPVASPDPSAQAVTPPPARGVPAVQLRPETP